MVHFFKILNKASKSDIKYFYTVDIETLKKDERMNLEETLT